ncbi:MAG: prepilin-type N-terminal cleavage/methylation domain-containing protein, partial [Lachnospiraceae bacterium]|nr:prepilin-type N-terminal cleavage/methylation domain-containing protein [Lachnospiraceae bacterium]
MKGRIRKKQEHIRNEKGFTLVELIVVLVVIAIVSSAAVFSVIGYIDKSRFNKNEQNAQSVYQAAQAAVNHMKQNGEAEEWVKKVLLVKGTPDPYYPTNSDMDADGKPLDELYNEADFVNFDETRNRQGESVHLRYILTYKKGGADEESGLVSDLISSYFYDTTVMMGTFTIEFDVEKAIGSDGKVHYGVNTYAVFYDEGRSDWDGRAMKELECMVPYRGSDYRSGTSLVGYYNGGMPGAVDSIYTPVADSEMEFAELSLKNDEELELNFSVINGNNMVTGRGLYNVHYTASIYDQDKDEKLADLVISEAALTRGVPTSDKPFDYASLLTFTPGSIKDGDVSVKKINGVEYPVLYSSEEITDEKGERIKRYSASTESFALVYVNAGSGAFDYNSLPASQLSGETDFYRFPLRISYVINESATGAQKNYVTYSIALDSMMSREALCNISKKSSNKAMMRSMNYSISRLFADTAGNGKTLPPKNIYVSMTAAADAFSDSSLAECNVTRDLPASKTEKATRAYDDPVYLQADGTYKADGAAAAKDTDYAVVNTYFGDLGNGSLGSKDSAGKAQVTAFRHLYNARFLEEFAGEVEYDIQRDLNWYVKSENGYSSKVKVYGITAGNSYLTYNSPVGKCRKYSSDINIVSWPALAVLPASQKIVAADDTLPSSAGETSMIRNVQMRRKSFLSTDKGLGFICVNKGTLQNVRCDSFVLTLDETQDGAGNDHESIAAAVAYLKTNGNENRAGRPNGADGKGFSQVPVGGLVGLNEGSLGTASAAAEKNITEMKNGIVMTGSSSGGNWTLYNKFDAAGGLVGTYAQTGTWTSHGTLSVTGRTVVSGYVNVGGVIGRSNGGIDAYIYVDSSRDQETAPMELTDTDSLVIGRQQVGGAVGYISGGYLAQEVSKPSYGCDDDGEGIVNITELPDAKYGAYVNLTKHSYVWQSGTESSNGVGGAVGQIDGHIGDKTLSIKIINAGYILSGSNSNGRNVGGAIGLLQNGAAAMMYISTENNGNIGTLDGASPYGMSYAAAGGVAMLKNFGTNNDIYVFNTVNNGKICCNTNGTNKDAGVGIAIGASLMDDPYPAFYVKAVNKGTVQGMDRRNGQDNDAHWKSGTVCDYGVGGAVGYMNGLKNSHIYAELASGSVITANGNNVGGAAGCLRKNITGK